MKTSGLTQTCYFLQGQWRLAVGSRSAQVALGDRRRVRTDAAVTDP